MVVAGVGDEEVPLAVGAVARDEALGLAEAGGRVAGGDEVVGCGGHFLAVGLGWVGWGGGVSVWVFRGGEGCGYSFFLGCLFS